MAVHERLTELLKGIRLAQEESGPAVRVVVATLAGKHDVLTGVEVADTPPASNKDFFHGKSLLLLLLLLLLQHRTKAL